jgi:hypothetical protein
MRSGESALGKDFIEGEDNSLGKGWFDGFVLAHDKLLPK